MPKPRSGEARGPRRNSRVGRDANGPGNPRGRSREPVVGTPSRYQVDYRPGVRSKSSYFKESRTPSANSPLVPERHSFTEGMDPEGFEPSPNTLMGYRATVTPRAHVQSLRQRGVALGSPARIRQQRVSFRESPSFTSLRECGERPHHRRYREHV